MHEIEKVLFIAPHPDDETLGCGGVIQKLKNANKSINWMIVTQGYPADGFEEAKILERQNEIEQVGIAYNFDHIFKLGLRTTMLDTYNKRDIIKPMAEIIQNFQPDTLFIPHRNDVHSDHRIVFDAAWGCCKSFRSSFIRNIYSYETVSETEYSSPFAGMAFLPNVFFDITDFLENKLDIIKIYRDEIQDHPFPRSIENLRSLAKFRGATAYVKYAEAFMCLKSIK